ncbi:Siderophore [Alcaligin] biosynthetic enzyme @ Siderophore biosynthesis protein, monooxygenase [plant metagenome]|uniref:Siderophore [Alcaligin] biosynthetic enzyme @ Siderophore biosynthesis protein, monooxygenase n=2 Tax=root TaxID=1 RepID=A0A1C3K7N5_9BURK|nr:SidA/IucD/PvdA family monooxygenase [Orrella dioscoreae]SBT27367.1 Siderophore [Alcaligin] biosynthetic enzyme @ Siderophore biosynthesis protein, monooxygenase [Orrella dioscoreae]SOE50044.1 Siderophore [Alcaligin] biosynthetic enzyme @ Siderophore biosynthesis protein, monooxygenase [Orrella dioscoreae]
MNRDTYDFLAIGLGPFNLGLACLSAPLPGVRALFLERKSGFDWHPGMLIQDSTLQNPFLADLVSLADPRSEFSYLNYCKQTGRIYSYYMRENHYLSRAEYNRYCQWAVSRLPNLRFGTEVHSVLRDPDTDTYLVSGQHAGTGERFMLRARKLVLGLGTQPTLPSFCNPAEAPYVHSADYLRAKAELQKKRSITVVGSGQSAGEVFHDLLRDSDKHAYSLAWITRSPRFFQMENTKLTLELISPDYTDYFFGLPEARQRQVLTQQNSLYKGMNATLINQIYDLLDQKIQAGDRRYTLTTNAELRASRHDPATGLYHLDFHHVDYGTDYRHVTDGLVLATGYTQAVPAFLNPIRDRIRWRADGRYRVARNYSIDQHGGEIFVQNGGLMGHGVSSPDLGFCCHRNSQILREITGVEHYKVEERIALQDFVPPLSGVLNHRGTAPIRATDDMAASV